MLLSRFLDDLCIGTILRYSFKIRSKNIIVLTVPTHFADHSVDVSKYGIFLRQWLATKALNIFLWFYRVNFNTFNLILLIRISSTGNF
jgi:hypothetical protein